MTHIFTCVVVIAVVVATRTQSPISDDAQIYRLALRAVVTNASAASRVALADSTVDMTANWQFAATMPNLPYLDPRTRITYAKSETIEAFLAASSKSQPVPPKLVEAPGFVVVDAARLWAVEEQGLWTEFAKANRVVSGSSAWVSASVSIASARRRPSMSASGAGHCADAVASYFWSGATLAGASSVWTYTWNRDGASRERTTGQRSPVGLC